MLWGVFFSCPVPGGGWLFPEEIFLRSEITLGSEKALGKKSAEHKFSPAALARQKGNAWTEPNNRLKLTWRTPFLELAA